MGLPVIGTLREALFNMARRHMQLFRALALSGGLVVALDIQSWLMLRDLEWSPNTIPLLFANSLLQALLWALIAVSCHRVFLYDPDQPSPLSALWLGLRQIRYVAKAIIVAIPLLINTTVYTWLTLKWLDISGADEIPKYGSFILSWGILIPMQYLSSRISLVLPAAALQQTVSFSQAWSITRENGWRMTAIILTAPAIFSLFSLITGPVLSSLLFVDMLIDALLRLILGVFIIASLSYSYIWFLKERHQTVNL